MATTSWWSPRTATNSAAKRTSAVKIKPIPKKGIVGEVALREAAAGEFRDVMNLVRRTLAATLQPGQPDPYVPVEAIFSDRVVVSTDGRFVAYPYSIDDNNQVSLGVPVEVTREFLPVAMREAAGLDGLGAQGVFIEAKDEQGLRWRVKVIQAGLSGNRNYYPDAVLREAVPLFEGARVFVKSDEEHLKGKGKSFGQLIGRISAPVFVEGQGKDSGEIQADLELLASSGEVPAKMLEAYRRGMADLFGFSIDAAGRAKAKGGKRMAQKITRVNSVDLIIEPGAGGQIINIIEAINPEESADMALRERMIEAVKMANKGALPDGLDINDDEALETAYREALAQDTHDDERAGVSGGNGAAAATADTVVSLDQVDERIRMVEARAEMRVRIAESTLPSKAKDKLRRQFDGMDRFTEAQVDEAIEAERDYLASFAEAGHVSGLGDVSRIENSGESRADKIADMLDAFFDPEHKNHRTTRSFRECYIEITGDRHVTGDLRNCDPVRLREALGETGFREALDSTSWSNVLGDSITRAMLRDYNTPTVYDVWRHLADVVSVDDFRTQERTRFGGYGALPAVAENGPYTALASPSDEKATYAISKRGGTETVSLEMIANNDAGAIQRIPRKLSRAARIGLGKFVLDFIANNPLIYDGVAWFAAGHNNLGTAALDATSLAAARLAMLKQTEAGSNERLGIPPMHLWVPADLEESAFDLFRRATNNDTDFIESMNMQVHPVWYWTDANDWAVTADKADIPIIEVGFLNGNEEPELFVQDSPTSGSLFSNDQITYKIRHVYGGNVLDYRGAYKAVVV